MYFLVHVAIILLLDIVCFLFVFPVAVPCLEKYSQVPTMHPRITMLYIHHNFTSPPILLWGFSDSETNLHLLRLSVYESAYIPLNSTADLQFCAAPPYRTERTYSTIHTLYCTGPTTGWAGRPATSFPLLRRTFIFTSCDSHYTVPLGRLPNPSRRDVV